MQNLIPSTVLHVGNILNNGYLNCKFLRQHGISSDSLTVDYRHVQAQPEWEEVYIRDPVDEFSPNWSQVDLGLFKRPEWFYDVWLNELPQLAQSIHDRHIHSIEKRHPIHRILGRESRQKLSLKKFLSPIARHLGLSRARLKFSIRQEIKNAHDQSHLPHWKNLIADYFRFYPDRETPLSIEDIATYAERARAHKELFDQYRIIQGYSLDPMYVAIACPDKPFVAFEHGTMREFPYEDSARGRLYALSLQKAEKVIITNADCNLSAQRLGLTNYVFIPHPVDEGKYSPQSSPLRKKLMEEHQVDQIFLAPARHHWKNCPPGLEKSWFKRNDILIRGLGKYFRSHPNSRILTIFFSWGQEVDESKELIRDLGFSERVRWEPISSKPVMKDFYNAADLVFDQFNDGIGTFGTVVPEALACAKPVFINYKKELHSWCYSELPPLINVRDPDEITQQLEQLLKHPEMMLRLGEQGRNWFLAQHSSQVVVSRMLDIYQEIFDKFGWKWKTAYVRN